MNMTDDESMTERQHELSNLLWVRLMPLRRLLVARLTDAGESHDPMCGLEGVACPTCADEKEPPEPYEGWGDDSWNVQRIDRLVPRIEARLPPSHRRLPDDPDDHDPGCGTNGLLCTPCEEERRAPGMLTAGLLEDMVKEERPLHGCGAHGCTTEEGECVKCYNEGTGHDGDHIPHGTE